MNDSEQKAEVIRLRIAIEAMLSGKPPLNFQEWSKRRLLDFFASVTAANKQINSHTNNHMKLDMTHCSLLSFYKGMTP